MAKQYENTELEDVDIVTSVRIPRMMKKDCKNKGIQLRQCFLLGYKKLTSGEVDSVKQLNAELVEMKQGNDRLHAKLTEMSLRILDLEKKNGVKNEWFIW